MAMMVQRLSAPRMVLAANRAVPERAFGGAVFLYLLAVVLPSELAINLFGLALIPVRIVLLALFIPAAARLLATKDFRPQAFDYLLLLGLAWLVLALSVNNGAEKGIKYGGSLAVEALGGYLIARAYIRNYNQFAKAVGFYFLFLLVVAAVAVPETFFAVRFVHPMASLLMGSATTSEAARLGLESASSALELPILFAVMCAAGFGLVWYVHASRRNIWIRMAAIAFAILAVVATVASPETFFAVRLFQPAASLMTGPATTKIVEAGRLGLERASSTLDHPILYGVFCATSFGLVWYVHGTRRDIWIRAAAIAFATFCAVSSAALLAIAFATAVIAWERWTRPFQQRTAITLAILAAAYIVLELLSNRTAVEVLIGFVALDPWTAYYRVLIWQNAFVDLAKSPLFGAALDAWTRPQWMTASVDSFWLVMALSAGLPTVAMTATMIGQLIRRVHARSAVGATREHWAARWGWTVAVLALCLQAFTVHYWGSMNSFFFFVLGMGAWMTDSASGLKKPANSAGKSPRAAPSALRRGTILRRQPRLA